MRDFLERNIPVDQCHFDSWQAPEEPLGYRNKLVLHAQKDGARTLLGYMNEGNQNVLDIPECPLACRQINEKLSELRSSKGFFHSIHNGHTLTLRYTQNDGVIYWRNSPKSGLSWLKEELPFGKFSVPAGSFHQINAFGSAALIENTTAILKAEKPEAVLDLYCGSGLFGVTAALAGVPQVKGIEIDKQAVESARYNLQQHGLNNAEIIAADAGKVFDKIVEDLPDSTILIVDPPRGGLGKKVKKSITETKIKGMIYISCGPDTLGRDLKMMHNSGFNLKYARMINMFPRTSHFETFTYLTRD
jgi:tRNA/tmRNA/rRNA uracil-C5-methylase (TrmA/RlmC/RlmD family)